MYRTFADVVTKMIWITGKAGRIAPSDASSHWRKAYNVVAERSGAQAAYMEKNHHPHGKTFLPDPRQDNPLKIINDARKAGLDYRLIEPHADDFARFQG